MNKKILPLVLLMCVISIYSLIYGIKKSTFALDDTPQPKIVIECSNTKINPSDTTTCYIRGKDFDYGVSSFEGRIELGSNLTLTLVEKDSMWQGEVGSGFIQLYTDVNKTGNFDLASFKITANNINSGSDTNISISGAKISDASFETINMPVTNLDIRIRSSVNSLSNLTINSNNILTNNHDYNLEIDNDYVTISATRVSNKSTLSGDIGEKTLNYGINRFEVIVTSESGLQNIYKINITRPDKLVFSNDTIVRTIDDLVYLIKKSTGNVANTSVEIKNEITTSGSVSITNKQDIVLGNNDKVGTGSKMNIVLSSEQKEYIIIIPGDTTGDGNIGVNDVAKLFQHLRKTTIIPDSDKHYILAGDVVSNDAIELNDIAKLFQYVRGTISSLN